jgi:hypothetical protein
MSQQPSPGSFLSPEWSYRLKGAQFGFIAGIVIGLIFGWIFHSVISLAFQFGLVAILLVPLLVIGWLWFRNQRASRIDPGAPGSGQPRGSWSTVIDVQTVDPMRRARAPEETIVRETEFIDVPLVRPTTNQRPDDIEAELEALKRVQERES